MLPALAGEDAEAGAVQGRPTGRVGPYRPPVLDASRANSLSAASSYFGFLDKISDDGVKNPCSAPTQRSRLVEIHDNLIARIEEAKREGWLGEVDGLQVSLAGAEAKIAQRKGSH
ncbi:hypothetical protein [Streptomyces sp. NPDC091259]|uniref:hypothetical protein n=1 Tax=Streptomyces sp. NPDC091259 TaxID=3365976 RepID=UPI0038058D22